MFLSLGLGFTNGRAGFNPNSIVDEWGNFLLKQALLISTTIPLSGILTDERTGLGTKRPAQPGRAYNLDGTDDRVQYNANIGISSYPCTIAVWAKADTLASHGVALWLGNRSVNNQYITIGFRSDSGGIIAGVVYTSAFTKNLTTPVVVNQWYRIVMVLESATSRKLYVNGVLVDTDLGNDAFPSGVNGLCLGRNNDSTPGANFNGKLKDAQFWNAAWDADDAAFDATSSRLASDRPGSTLTLTNLRAAYFCEDTHGSGAYDSSGNENHASKINITISTFHYEGSDTPYSFQNDLGYSDTNIPVNLLNPVNNVFDDPLDYTGTAPNNAQLVNSPCGTFDGVDDVLAMDGAYKLDLNKEFDISFRIKDNATASPAYISWTRGDENITLFYVSSDMTNTDKLRVLWRNSSNVILVDLSTSATVFDNTWHTIKLVYDGAGGFSIYVDGVLDVSTTFTPSGTFTPTRVNVGALRRTITSLFTSFSLCDFNINGGGLQQEWYPFSENSGATVHDVSGNGNHGTVTGATTGTGTGFWGATQDDYHWSASKGFTKVGGIEVPALTDGSADAQGNAITNPSGVFHNGGTTDINFAPTAAISGTATWENAWAFNAARTNPLFKRTLQSSGVDAAADRFLAYSTVLSGSDLTNLQTYTATKEI